MDFPACWNDERLVIYQGYVSPRGPRVFSDGTPFGRLERPDVHLRGDPTALDIAWHDLVALEALEPWPRLRVEFRHDRSSDDRVLAPRREAAIEEGIATLFDVAREHAVRARIERGWLDVPVVHWEPVAHLPGEAPPHDDGYRARASDDTPEAIVAHREGPGAFVALLQTLFGTSPPKRELWLGTEHLYGRDRSGLARLPRRALRTVTRLGAPDELDADEVFLFGRRTHVVFTRPRFCAVARALRTQLGGW